MSAYAERALIGALVIDGQAIKRVREIVLPIHFRKAGLRAIYQCMLTVDNRGEPVDYVTVMEEVEWSGVLERFARGRSKRASLVTATVNCAPSSLNVEAYARLVAQEAIDQHRRANTSWLAE